MSINWVLSWHCFNASNRRRYYAGKGYTRRRFVSKIDVKIIDIYNIYKKWQWRDNETLLDVRKLLITHWSNHITILNGAFIITFDFHVSEIDKDNQWLLNNIWISRLLFFNSNDGNSNLSNLCGSRLLGVVRSSPFQFGRHYIFQHSAFIFRISFHSISNKLRAASSHPALTSLVTLAKRVGLWSAILSQFSSFYILSSWWRMEDSCFDEN